MSGQRRLEIMKTLYLLRHAKSSWGNADLPDHERPLNERGRKAASAMGRYLRGLPHHPELALVSTARRVAETLDLVLPELAGDVAVIRDRALYLASPETLLQRLGATSTESGSLLIIGHNPGIHEFALQLVGEVGSAAARDARDRLKASYPTAALAVIRFPEAEFWRDIAVGEGRLESFIRPKDLET
jgi:phosphohistidine phosphatase